jgi:hypothetical protein
MNWNNNAALVPESHRIQDLEGWLESNGLRGPDDDVERGFAEHAALEARLAESAAYAQSVHDAVFKELSGTDDAMEQEERRKRLRRIKYPLLNFRTSDGVIENVPMEQLVWCDTIMAKVNSWSEFSTNGVMEFSLESFPKSSVQEFISVLSDDSRSPASISSDAIVDCCLIAHFLCSDKILGEISKILIASIDTSNCFSLCQLADELNLPTLFERSLAHMMDTIGDLESNEAYEDLTPELQSRIASIKSAIESSIHSGSRLYFASLEEYISIFAERVQYYQERLIHAKEQQQLSRHKTPAWYDAQTKIERQERRVRTLESALAEHKKLFCPMQTK